MTAILLASLLTLGTVRVECEVSIMKSMCNRLTDFCSTSISTPVPCSTLTAAPMPPGTLYLFCAREIDAAGVRGGCARMVP